MAVNTFENPDNEPLKPTPLESGKRRDPEVERQISYWMNCLPRAIVVGARVKENGTGYIRSESLVFLFRYLLSSKQEDAAWKLADILFERSLMTINSKFRRYPTLKEEDQKDVQQEVFLEIINALQGSGASADFWEIRYWKCLACRVSNVLAKTHQVAGKEETISLVGDEDDSSPLEFNLLFADLSQMTPDERVLYADAFSRLSEQERLAFHLFHFQGYSQDEIAETLGVKSDRTVRNYLSRAQDKLKQWYFAN